MAFNSILALSAAGKVVDIADKGANIYNEVADGHTRRKETRKNGDTDHTIRTGHAKTEDICAGVNTAIDALNTVADVFNKISDALNVSKETNSKIEERRNQFKLEKQKLDNELEKINKNYAIKMEKKDKSHEAKMAGMKYLHEREMAKISTVRETVNKMLDFMIELAKEDPSNPFITSSVSNLTTALNSLSINSNMQYIEEK